MSDKVLISSSNKVLISPDNQVLIGSASGVCPTGDCTLYPVRVTGSISVSCSSDDGCCSATWSGSGSFDTNQFTTDLTICDLLDWSNYAGDTQLLVVTSASNCYGGTGSPCFCSTPPDNVCADTVNGSLFIRMGIYCTPDGPEGPGWYFFCLIDALSGCGCNCVRATFASVDPGVDPSPWSGGYGFPGVKYKDIGSDYTGTIASVIPLNLFPGLGDGLPVCFTGSATLSVTIIAE